MTPALRKTGAFFFGLLVLLMYGLSAGQAGENEKFFEIKAKKFSYTPNIIRVQKGDTVNLRLVSEDVHHGFYLDGYGLSMTALPGKEGNLKFVAGSPGRFMFRCSVTCGEFHPYMIGHLRVEPNTPFWLFAAGVAVLFAGALLFALSRRMEDQEHVEG